MVYFFFLILGLVFIFPFEYLSLGVVCKSIHRVPFGDTLPQSSEERRGEERRDSQSRRSQAREYPLSLLFFHSDASMKNLLVRMVDDGYLACRAGVGRPESDRTGR